MLLNLKMGVVKLSGSSHGHRHYEYTFIYQALVHLQAIRLSVFQISAKFLIFKLGLGHQGMAAALPSGQPITILLSQISLYATRLILQNYHQLPATWHMGLYEHVVPSPQSTPLICSIISSSNFVKNVGALLHSRFISHAHTPWSLPIFQNSRQFLACGV